MKLLDLFKKPCIIGLVANVNEGKSNLLYSLIIDLKRLGNHNIYSFGLKKSLGENKFYSVEELESIKDGVIFLDEMMTLFDLNNRKIVRQIESTLRLVNHNNNILVLCGLPDNFKKFLASKVNYWLFKKVTFADFINGSIGKRIILNYQGLERGTETLNLNINEVLIYNSHYFRVEVPYIQEMDTKKDNKEIVNLVPENGKIVPKSVPKKMFQSVLKNVPKNVPEEVEDGFIKG